MCGLDVSRQQYAKYGVIWQFVGIVEGYGVYCLLGSGGIGNRQTAVRDAGCFGSES